MRTITTSIITVLTVTLLLLTTVGCSGDKNSGRHESQLSLAQDVNGLTGLFLAIDQGSITVNTGDVDSVRVNASVKHGAEATSVTLVGQLRGDVLDVRAQTAQGKPVTVGEFTVTVPPSFSLWLTTKQGSVTVHDHAGSLKVTCQQGSVAASFAAVPESGKIDLRTAQGSVDLSLPGSGAYAFEARTTEGSVTVDGLEKVRWEVNEPQKRAGSSGPTNAGQRLSVLAYSIQGSVTIHGR